MNTNENTNANETATATLREAQDIYRSAARIFAVVNDPATPDAIRLGITEQIAMDIQNVVTQLDFQNRAVITQLWPLALELSAFALYVPPDDSLAGKVQAIRSKAA